MKRITIIRLAVVTYIAAMIAMFLGVQKYIENKDNRLRNEIHDKISEIFAHQDQFVDIAYSGYKVGSEKVSIPPKPVDLGVQTEESKKLIGDIHRQSMDKWKENYGDLYELHRVFYKRSDWSSPYDYEDGWNLVIIKHDYEGVYVNWFFPYAVGYKKQDYQWEYSYLPSIKTAVEEAFEFFTSNPKSQYYNDFEKGSYTNVWSKIYDAENEYYYILKDENMRFWHSGVNGLFEESIGLNDKSSPFQYGYMHNGYYKVFTALTQPQTYTITKKTWGPAIYDKKNLLLYWSIGITLLLLLIIIPLGIIERKHKKEKEESLYDKLKRLCNPANFMSKDDYDKEKVDKANEIYDKLISINPEDKESLNEIQLFAVKELGVNLINKDRVQELIEKVNPKNFINPYNAEKVALANELYAIVKKENLTYNELEEVEDKAKTL
ncbi:MAG: hypothetical protein SOU95_00325 [Candidatus Cryptobacteroides sp.]|nr:hypothetical protein [Bacteroidales bacterium]MDD6964108.1 hypothetical protein [Bacillota bacterium]MDY2772955.1 hypothetical protein [Candidatus Cryptobacteroides sp.]